MNPRSIRFHPLLCIKQANPRPLYLLKNIVISIGWLTKGLHQMFKKQAFGDILDGRGGPKRAKKTAKLLPGRFSKNPFR